MDNATSIRIVAILGSVRAGNMTGKALALVVEDLRERHNVAVDMIDPSNLDLPFPGRRGDPAAQKQVKDLVSAATGVVLATPEYHGSFSSVMKLIVENLGFPSALAGKPVALLGVAAGAIGAIKALEHLRSVCSHIGAITLPGAVSVAHVDKFFDSDGRCTDAPTEQRIRGVAASLMDYIHRHVCPGRSLEQVIRGG